MIDWLYSAADGSVLDHIRVYGYLVLYAALPLGILGVVGLVVREIIKGNR